MEPIQYLSQSLQTGFIDHIIHSKSEYLPQLLVNDKDAGKKVLSTIKDELNRCDEFWFSVAFVTTSGIATLINSLDQFEKEGKKGKILVSQYLNFTQPVALKRLLEFRNIELKIAVAGDFHSKGYLFKHGNLYDLIIGSSNLTANALCSNIEWNLKVSATSESSIILNAINEFSSEFQRARRVTPEYIALYESIYNKGKQSNEILKIEYGSELEREIQPNSMQVDALDNIKNLRQKGNDKALLISATGTGKTFLSAFDVEKFNPNKFLFVVHRLNIANAAMDTFRTVFGASKSMGLYSGNIRDLDKDFIFATIQTISKDEHLKQFESNHFDYIVIDETHRAGAESYTRILNHFEPKFLLGMTATPERTDGFDIFSLFDHNIAYEIRLHRALEENMLSPFHYYGVTDISVNGVELEEHSDFSLLTSPERIKHVIDKAKHYGCDDGVIRGLIFCSRKEECKIFSDEFNRLGYKTIALVGENSEEERASAINLLESDDLLVKLDYIFTVDIFNEGIDIPRVNQIIMLRPTQSAIVFVQQLGRGLRKIINKEYLTVIDFIGNYNNNFLVPIALYGDTSYNKDSLRKLMSSGSNLIPGTSTINFDEISRNRIFAAIDSANMQMKRDLVNDYNLLKFKLGRIPMMVDFVEHGSRDPQLYVSYSKSYFNFVATQEADFKKKISPIQKILLELFSTEIANAKRIEEVIIAKALIEHKEIRIDDLKDLLKKRYDVELSDETVNSCIRNLNFDFVHKSQEIVINSNGKIIINPAFNILLDNIDFRVFLNDVLDYAETKFDSHFSKGKYCDGFILYQKYSRKDVCRLLNWDHNEDSTMYGYRVKHGTCPIFVNYHKEENIAASTKFEDKFISNVEFQWFTKPRRNLLSEDVVAIKNYKNGLRLPLFIKKSNGEGDDFYYMGDVTPIEGGFMETTIENDKGNKVSVVRIMFSMNHPVEDNIFNYITNSTK